MLSATSKELQDYAAKRWPRGNQTSRIFDLAKELKISFRRMKSIFYAEQSTRLSPEETLAIKALLDEAVHENTDISESIAQLQSELERQAALINRLQMALESASSNSRSRAH